MKVNLTTPVCLLSKIEEEAWRWHARFGHLNFRALRDLGVKDMVDGLPLIRKVEQVCDGCALGKHHRRPFPQVSSWRASTGLELVHTDLCGQITPPTPGGKSYFMLIVDDYSRFMWIELLTSKAEALSYFKKFRTASELESGRRLKALRSDRGGEFNSRAFVVFCEDHGIRHNTTAPYTPQQNGVVERRNQTVVEMARCLLKSMNVPPRFWREAVTTAVYILNRSPTKSLQGQTPYQAWYGKKPGVKHLRTFGCTAFAKIVGPGSGKLTDRSVRGIFLGYEPGSKAYRVYDPVKDKLLVTRDVVFDEQRPWDWGGSQSEATGPGAEADTPDMFQVDWGGTVGNPTADAEDDTGDSSDADLDDTGDSSDADLPVPDEAVPGSPALSIPQSGGVLNTPPHTPPAIQWATPPTGQSADSEGVPLRYRTIPDLLEATDPVENYNYSGVCFLAAEEPRSLEEAMTEQCWRKAMESEMQAIESNRTWDISDLPPKHKAIGLKWVFKVKDPDGRIVKHKACLVAKGYAQHFGVDYDEVYAPVARMETVRVLLALAAKGGWEVHHMDVKSAFLNADLTETVYVQQLPGFIVGDGSKVLKLRKALYGLKQAPRAWNAKLDRELLALGFVRSKLDHAVYRRSNANSFLIVGVYVDDLIISGPSAGDIKLF